MGEAAWASCGCACRFHYLDFPIRIHGQVDGFSFDAFLRGFLGFPLSVDSRRASRIVVLPPLSGLTEFTVNRQQHQWWEGGVNCEYNRNFHAIFGGVGNGRTQKGV